MERSLKKVLKDRLPVSCYNILKGLWHILKLPNRLCNHIMDTYHTSVLPKRYQKNLERIKDKSVINCVFLALDGAVWKYDALYRLMKSHPRFNPVIAVCPIVNYGFENMLKKMDECYQRFHTSEYEYNVVKTYDSDTGGYLDIKKTLSPDIVFYTNPYKGLIDDRYYITHFFDCLTCYVPYGPYTAKKTFGLTQLVEFAWKFYSENEMTYELERQIMKNRARNALIVGYPSMDIVLEDGYVPKNIWKHKQKIKIIWAPHHSIDEECEVHFSHFLQISEKMVELAKKYQDYIQIAFKPHPLLYEKLLRIWGKEKTDSYYSNWENGDNSQLENGAYEDLFSTSDAMIFDSVAFMYEYLTVRKKALFIYSDDIEGQLNEFGKLVLHTHQLAYKTDDIEDFIVGVIQGEADPMKEKKEKFYENFVLSPTHKLASETIFEDIMKELGV